MPTYLYECPYHGEFEIEQKITEDALEACPKSVKVVMGKDEGKTKQCCSPVKRLIAGNVSVTWKGGAPTSKTYV